LIATIDGGKTLMVVDAERIWMRPTAGGAWRTQPYASALRELYRGEPRRAALSPDGKLLAISVITRATQDPNRVVLWDLAKGQAAGRQIRPAGGLTSSLSYATNGKIVASVALNKIHLWEVKNSSELIPGLISQPLNAQSVACSPTGGLLAVGTHRGDVRLVDSSTFEIRWTQPVHGSRPVMSVAWSADGQRLIAASDTGSAVLNAADGREIFRLPTTAYQPVFSPDGRWIAAAPTTLSAFTTPRRVACSPRHRPTKKPRR
jgi:WD40 repeat protein